MHLKLSGKIIQANTAETLAPPGILWISTSALKSPFLGFLYLEFPQRKKIVMATNNSGLNSTFLQ